MNHDCIPATGPRQKAFEQRETPGILRFGSFHLDQANEQLWCGRRRLLLKPKTLAVLEYLLEHARRLITKEELLNALWKDVHVNEAVLKSHLREIRTVLGDDARSPRFIETVHTRGYRFLAAVRRESGSVAAAVEAPGFVGRASELVRLQACLARAMEGSVQFVFITGDAGAGKTTLANRFVNSLESRDDVLVARGQCVAQYGAGEAYMPMLEALERLCRGRRREPVLEVLRQRCPSWLSHVPALVEVRNARPGPAMTGPERMLREMAEAVVALGSAQPVVLLFEDLHWADHSTLQLLSYVARRSDSTRVLIVGTYRPRNAMQREAAFADSFHEVLAAPNVEELVLAGLTEGDLAEYLAMRFPGHRFPEGLLALLGQRTSGNPLFVTRMLDHLLQRGCLLLGDDGWHIEAPLADLERMIPDTLSRTLQRELDRLEPFQRRVLEAASVVGTEFSAPLVAAALAEDTARIEDVCAGWARQRELIRLVGTTEWPDGTVALRCAFQHGLYQQLAYDGLSATRLAELHRRVAARLEAAHVGHVGAVAAELAMHFERARDWHMTLHYGLTAAEAALQRGAYREALDHLARGLEVLPRLPTSRERDRAELRLRVLQGGTLATTRGYADPDVDRAYVRARELCARLDDDADALLSVLIGIWKFYQVKGDCRTAGDLGQQAALLWQRQPRSKLHLAARGLFGVTSFYLGRFREARTHLQDLLPLIDDEPGRPGASEAEPGPQHSYAEDAGVLIRSQLSLTLWMLGSPEQAFAMADAAVGAATRLNHPFSLVLALYHRCLLLQYERRHAAVLPAAEAVLALCDEHGFPLFAAMASMLKGASLSVSDHHTGLQALEEGWRAFTGTGAGIAGSCWRSVRAEALARGGRIEEGASLLEEALEIAQRLGDHSWEPEMYRLQGELILGRGGAEASEREAAERLFLKSLEVARECGALSLELRATTSLVRLWRNSGHVAEAHVRLRDCVAAFSPDWHGPDLVEARLLLNELVAPLHATPPSGSTSRRPRST